MKYHLMIVASLSQVIMSTYCIRHRIKICFLVLRRKIMIMTMRMMKTITTQWVVTRDRMMIDKIIQMKKT